MLDILGQNELLLASKSPRRKDLLQRARISFELISSDWEEKHDPKMDVRHVPKYLAYNKANAIRSNIKENQILLTADTVVIRKNELLGKPKNEDEARTMLKKLSGKKHHVITGITLMSLAKTVNCSAVTKVQFDHLTNQEIDYYIWHDRPLDKAGAYGIQDWIGVCKIKKIKGNYENVMGLPVHLVYAILSQW